MTAATLCGPLLFGLALRGGDNPDWPPDRPIEWGALAGTSGLVLALIVLTIAYSLALQKRDARARSGAAAMAERERGGLPPERGGPGS
jgi:hypothetical protein